MLHAFICFFFNMIIICIFKCKSIATGLNSDNYALVGCSLEDLQKLEQVLLQCGLDVTCPTLILSEVVMCYLSPSRYIELF